MGQLLAFLGIAVLVIVTPGQDTALIIRQTLRGGQATGIAAAVGVAIGQGVWTVATSVGLAALLVTSERAFALVKLLGAAYLIWLGALSLWNAWRGAGAAHGEAWLPARPLTVRVALRQGVISNLGNPKMAVFFSSLLPQFVPAGDRSFLVLLALGLLFCTMTLVWLSGYAVVAARAGDLLRRSRVRRALDTLMGLALVALGVRLATASR